MSFNVHGLENKCLFPDFFEFIKSHEVFALLETHLCENKVDHFKKYFKGFELYLRHASRQSKYGRGIGGCLYGVREDIQKLGIEHVFETIDGVDIINIRSKSLNFNIVPLYIRGADWKKEFSVVKNMFVENNVINPIVIGDINARIGEEEQVLEECHRAAFKSGTGQRKSRDKQTNSSGRTYLEFCSDNGLVVMNGRTFGDEEGEFTYISKNGNSVNDLCSVSMDILHTIQKFSVISKIWSDHLPIQLSLEIPTTEQCNSVMKLAPKLIWRDKLKDKYQSNLNNNLEAARQLNNNLSLNDFAEIIKSSTDQPKPRKHFDPGNKWYDIECENARDKSFQYLKKHRESELPEDRCIYLEYNKLYKKICKEKQEAYAEELENKINLVNDSKEWWKIVKEIKNEQFEKGSNLSSATFEKYFEKLLNPEQLSENIQYAPMYHEDSILDRPISLGEIKATLKKAKLNKAAGEDRIPYEFFINATDEFLTDLSKAYTHILNTGNIDESFIKSIVFPIFKKGDANDPSNYRGISFMNCIAKIMMGIINERLTVWVNSNNILNEYQAGFRKTYSAMDNILNLASIVHLKFEEKKKFTDFSSISKPHLTRFRDRH